MFEVPCFGFPKQGTFGNYMRCQVVRTKSLKAQIEL
jgi:hypothetical protein